MFDDYQIPAILLIAALLLAFSYLHSRFRSVRTLLWLLALSCAELQSLLQWMVSHWLVPAGGHLPYAVIWLTVGSESAFMLSSAFFLASLSPVSFKLGKIEVLYVVPYTIPILIYSILYYGVTLPTGHTFLWIYAFLAFWAAAVAVLWGLQKGRVPLWIAALVIGFAAAVGTVFFLHRDVHLPLLVVEAGNMFMTTLLVCYTFPRLSPGVFLTSSGFVLVAIPPFFQLVNPFVPFDSATIVLARMVILGKIIVAMGLILLVLEDEVDKNEDAQRRERRVRLELEAYARPALTARSLEEFDRESSRLCYMIVQNSYFHTAGLLVRTAANSFTLAGYSGMDGATAGALDALAQRLPATALESCCDPLVPQSSSINLDLTPWLAPGDDLERLNITHLGAVPLRGPDHSIEGAILLGSPEAPVGTLHAEDLMPLEVLAGRLQAARAQAMMLGKLIDSERFAGVGQLANNVAQQLNNPLTVILGYSALLEESASTVSDRRAVEAITQESRRMKSILDRLSRFSRISSERYNAFSIADLITDVEQMHRTDFLRNSIEFRMSIEPEMPQIFGNAHQLRQALLHATQYAIDSVMRVGPNQERSIRIEAMPSPEDGRVRVLIAHSGQGFLHPERAFDSLASGFAGADSPGIGLSLCAAIVREHRGSISAVNYSPTGAGILLDLPVS